MRVLVVLALVGFTTAAMPKRQQQRIVGGTPTTVETYPYMSNMQYLYGGVLWVQWCGGSLINTQSVLTAAHCYYGDHVSEWRVRLGTSDASSGGTVHYASQLIFHANYDYDTNDNDIAIVRLANPATYGPSVNIVSIGGPNYNLADGTPVTTIGWGSLVAGGAGPERLQHVDIDIINQELCVRRYDLLRLILRGWPEVTDNMLCAGILNVGGKDACQGDSGGPLVHNGNVLVGIVSWGFSCANSYFPGVNARVSRYTDWIVANA